MATPSNNSIYDTIDKLSISPIPAAVLGGSLVLKGLFGTNATPVEVSANGGGGGGSGAFKLGRKVAIARPTRSSCFTFGGASLLGAWMMYDGDPVNASGFNFAWSVLYLMVNGKASVSNIFKGRITPLGLSGLALVNTGLYGREFFWSKNSPFK
ncbi:conserved hypothetical protein [Candida dubliniensis CD36]|uniref:Uncharacterized protein n=1 Tax=Candida dubliniensis (strain CD36 / ATCC MYA-646 / CBS 7987 / NCPF 3949 / NRRL Y-17841) TaxID=573826 RepID=B9WM86_CANDC|nr:conserved hypothetical protein [Candida dubliniensis CD36]CAX40199.1 conserved hypothetical protein [Candida dubliniensis CD36]